MKRIQQLISGCLALCFAFAGAVGVSPLLHQLIEHGGHGPLHIHSGVALPANVISVWHDDGDGHLHQHLVATPSPKQTRPQKLFAHSHEFELPTIPFNRLIHALSQVFENDAPNPESPVPSGETPVHHHHSLPQMMLSGLLDQHVDVPLLQFIFVPQTWLAPMAEAPLLARDWDAQTQSRGPPSARS